MTLEMYYYTYYSLDVFFDRGKTAWKHANNIILTPIGDCI